MRRPKVFKLFTSVFTKLLAIIFFTGFSITLAVIFYFGAFRHHVTASYEPHLTGYVSYLVKDLGQPPDLRRAEDIASRTGMVIAYRSPDHRWRTAPPPFKIDDEFFRIMHRSEDIEVGRRRGRMYVKALEGDSRFIFYLPNRPGAKERLKAMTVGLFFIIGIFMLCAWFAIRRVLKPLGWLKQGVQGVSRGDLEQRVPVRGSDELRDLSNAFNTMAERLNILIQSKDQLLLDVSHELRTPITRLKVALAMLPDTIDKAGLAEDLDEMEQKINELLDTARAVKTKASLNYAPVDPAALIGAVAAQLAVGTPDVRISTPSHMPEIMVDPEQVRKALKNIVDNARKYSDADGPPVEIELSHQPPFAVIAVKDHGIGIPPEDHDLIFEPFYRVDKARTPRTGGYGLGLSLAKTIVEVHGGRIEVASTPGQGSIFTIYLPMKPDTEKPA